MYECITPGRRMPSFLLLTHPLNVVTQISVDMGETCTAGVAVHGSRLPKCPHGLLGPDSEETEQHPLVTLKGHRCGRLGPTRLLNPLRCLDASPVK